MTDAPSKVAEAIAITRRTRPIVWQNIIIALGVKLVFIALSAITKSGFADRGGNPLGSGIC